MRHLAVLAVSAVLAWGCSEPSSVTTQAEPLREVSPPELPPDLVLLDARPDGSTIRATVLPAVPNGDPDRVLVLHPIGAPELSEGERALDARFVSSGVVVLGADHVLRHRAAGVEREVDSRVEGPLSVVGEVVAYTRGEVPELVVRRADLSSRSVETVMPDEQPAWSPALSPDGRDVVFVSARTGQAQLVRTDAGGLSTTRFPTMPVAPIWTADDRLVFEDEQGLATLDLTTGGVLEARPALRRPVLFDGHVFALESGAWTRAGELSQ